MKLQGAFNAMSNNHDVFVKDLGKFRIWNISNISDDRVVHLTSRADASKKLQVNCDQILLCDTYCVCFKGNSGVKYVEYSELTTAEEALKHPDAKCMALIIKRKEDEIS